MSRIAIVVPCYNEEKRLDTEAFRAFHLPGHELRFLFVNDGSRDGTLRVLQALRTEDAARFDVLDLPRNCGKSEAVRNGIVNAAEGRPDFVGFWDADLATPLAELPTFINVFNTRPEIDLVFGARVRLLGRDISRNASRHYIGRIGATLISQTLGLAIYDTQCGAKLFRLDDAVRQVFATPFLSKWIFDVEIIARYLQLRGRDRVAGSLYELPLTRWRDVQGSKVGPFDFVKALRDLWRIRRAYRQ